MNCTQLLQRHSSKANQFLSGSTIEQLQQAIRRADSSLASSLESDAFFKRSFSPQTRQRRKVVQLLQSTDQLGTYRIDRQSRFQYKSKNFCDGDTSRRIFVTVHNRCLEKKIIIVYPLTVVLFGCRYFDGRIREIPRLDNGR